MWLKSAFILLEILYPQNEIRLKIAKFNIREMQKFSNTFKLAICHLFLFLSTTVKFSQGKKNSMQEKSRHIHFFMRTNLLQRA